MNEFNNNFFNDNEENLNIPQSNVPEDNISQNSMFVEESQTYSSEFKESVLENSTISDNHEKQRSDDFYMPDYDPVDINSHKFYTTSKKPCKKKKYMSVKAAVVSLVACAIISITGGALLSGIGFSSGLINISGLIPGTSVMDNINNSSSQTGTPTAHNSLTGEPLSTPEIVDKVGPAVVGIINKTTYGNAYGYYGSLYGDLNKEIEQGSGSGVILSSDGYIVTNNHVVENASAISVVLNTGEEYKAKLIGTDASTDLAVIKIDAKNLTYAQMGNSSNLRVGETAIAIGNPLGQEFAGTTTQGIISGLNRSVTIDNKTLNLIQTDAAINPGNSGGALVNEYGYLIGINTAKISSNTLEGLGFAIPVDEAKPIIQELMTNGYVTGRPVIGIGGRAVTKEDARAYDLKIGVYVSSMTPNGPAYMAGIKIGDIIVECEGEPIETVDDINKIKNKKSPGDKLSIKVYRKGSYVDVSVILGEETPITQ